MRFRIFLLLCLATAAVGMAVGAFRSIRGPWDSMLPAEYYSSLIGDAEQARYVLRARDGYVAVFPNRRSAPPERITSIELSTLRSADRAMLRRGIPAADRPGMLQLLEDLGS